MVFKALLSFIVFTWYEGINLYLQYIFSIYIKYVCIKTLSKWLSSIKPYYILNYAFRPFVLKY